MDCGDCKFFRQHYVISSGRYMALDYGHCVARCRKKMYAADTTACERYEQSTGETLPPVSYFYITVMFYQNGRQKNVSEPPPQQRRSAAHRRNPAAAAAERT